MVKSSRGVFQGRQGTEERGGARGGKREGYNCTVTGKGIPLGQKIMVRSSLTPH